MKYIPWEEYYKVAEELYEKLGTINVPTKYKYNGYNIGEWVTRQRGIQRTTGLKPERKRKLDLLNIIWNDIKSENHHQKFLQMYALLQKYKRLYGDTRVPRKFVMEEQPLGEWASAIRETLRGNGKRRITEAQRTLLDEIGFEVSWYQESLDSSWDEHYACVLEFSNLYGVDSIMEKTTHNGKRIGHWSHVQRIAHKDGKLSPERYQRLADIGFDFAPAANRWEKAFVLAEKYYDEFHDLNVPNDFVMDGFCIGAWISNQRQIYNGSRSDMILSPEQIARLESIGMRWQAAGGSNTSFIELAFFYYIKQIFPDAKARDKTFDIELDIYIPSIKTAVEYDGSYWHKDKIEEDNHKDDICGQSGIQLIRIRENPLPSTKSTICYFAPNRHTNDSLNALIRTVIAEQFAVDCDIDTRRDSFAIIKELQATTRHSWYKLYLEAEEYYRSNGHLLVPASYISPSGVRLGAWIQNQRSAYKHTAYGTLSPKEIQMLNSIGMVWDIREDVWNRNYKIAQKYYEEFGNLLVPWDCVYCNVKLGQWIRAQRNAHSCHGRRRMSTERCEKLEAIGMVWNTRPKS